MPTPTIKNSQTNSEVMLLLGARLKGRRLGHNIPIDSLADRSGINRKTVIDIEAGKDVRFSSLVKLLRGMDMLTLLEVAFPDVLPGGEGISTRGQPRQKASSGRRRHGAR